MAFMSWQRLHLSNESGRQYVERNRTVMVHMPAHATAVDVSRTLGPREEDCFRSILCSAEPSGGHRRCEIVITHVKIPTPGAKRVGKRVLGARIIASSIALAVLEHGAWEPLGS